MKILQVIYSLSSGGGERFVVDLSNRLSMDPSNEVLVLSIMDSSIPSYVHYLPDLSPKVRFINLHQTKGLSYTSLLGIYKVIQAEQPDIVHCHSNLTLIYLPALILRKPKYVHTLHNLAHYCAGTKINKIVNGILYRYRVKPVTISTKCNSSYIELYGRKDAECINNGREPLSPSSSTPQDIILSEGVPVFIHIARHAPQKNQNRLFYAFDKLHHDGIKYELICIGSNYDEYIEKYQNHPQIHILGERKNVADYVALADYFVLSSDFEGLPLTLLEAMSLGVTPISTPAGGVVDVIKDKCNGYLSKGFEYEEFYLIIKNAIMEKNQISPSIIKRSYEDNFSMKACAEKYYHLYINK